MLKHRLETGLKHWLLTVLLLSTCSVLLPGSSSAAATTAATPATPVKTPLKILVFGDSISAAYGMRADQGWVALLQKRLTQQGYGYTVVNASVSGETTVGGRARLQRALDLHRPAIVVLELGGNDGLRGLPVRDMRANLEAMIAAVRKSGAQVVLVGMRMPTNYGALYTQQFQDAFKALADKHRLAFVPFLLDGVALEESLMQPDGIHPSVAAQPRLLDTLWPALRPLLKRAI